MTLTMPTRELVGLLADVHPFASKDDEDSTWHRVVLRWDGSRLFAFAGDSTRCAQMSWGPDDGDDVPLPGFGNVTADPEWELAILPQNAKEIATKFKLSPKDGEAPLRVDGSANALRVERDAEAGGAAIRLSALARPWDDNAPRIDEIIAEVAEKAALTKTTIAYEGARLVDFVNPKVVRQRGVVRLSFGPKATYIEIGRHFRGAVWQADADA